MCPGLGEGRQGVRAGRQPGGPGVAGAGMLGGVGCCLRGGPHPTGPAAAPGPPPRPQLRPLWRGAVTPGRDAVLRCEGQVPDVTFELLRAGEKEASTQTRTAHRSADLVLTYVGPQHVGNYSCRYRRLWPKVLVSEFSEPVELQVAGEVFLWFCGFCELASSCWPLPRMCPASGLPLPFTSSEDIS